MPHLFPHKTTPVQDLQFLQHRVIELTWFDHTREQIARILNVPVHFVDFTQNQAERYLSETD